jgi:hypothetical protein
MVSGVSAVNPTALARTLFWSEEIPVQTARMDRMSTGRSVKDP